MKNIKRIIGLTCALTSLFSAVAMTGCKKGGNLEGEQVLEVMAWEAGYGVEFGEKLLEAFKEEAWVKEKYPNLVTKYDYDANMGTLNTKMDAGERANTVDLFFGSGNAYEGKDNSGKELLVDLTDVVYNTKVPGEDITVLEKMDDSFVDTIWYYEKGQDSNTPDVPFKAYAMPWASGMDCLLYNADYLRAMNQEVPLTTNQFLEVCERIHSEKPFDYTKQTDGDFAILTDGGGLYWHNYFNTWWGQYETVDGYYDFCNGVAGGRISADIHRQKGKLYSMQVLEKALKWDNGYLYHKRTGLDFMQAQTEFVKGFGTFYSNGDWFAKEMEQITKDVEEIDGIKYDIRLMATPILSEIIEKTPTIPDEQTLRAVIRAIDAGYTYATMLQATFEGYELVSQAEVSKEDYELIMEARGVVHTIGASHRAYIPAYAQGKEVACDFLRFMATDKAQEVYLETTGGASLPFEYNVKQKNPELYEKLLPIEKDRLELVYDSVYKIRTMPDPNSFPLIKWGEMRPIYSMSGNAIVALFASKGATTTARQVWEDDIKYYIDGGNFNICRDRAGLN